MVGNSQLESDPEMASKVSAWLDLMQGLSLSVYQAQKALDEIDEWNIEKFTNLTRDPKTMELKSYFKDYIKIAPKREWDNIIETRRAEIEQAFAERGFKIRIFNEPQQAFNWSQDNQYSFGVTREQHLKDILDPGRTVSSEITTFFAVSVNDDLPNREQRLLVGMLQALRYIDSGAIKDSYIGGTKIIIGEPKKGNGGYDALDAAVNMIKPRMMDYEMQGSVGEGGMLEKRGTFLEVVPQVVIRERDAKTGEVVAERVVNIMTDEDLRRTVDSCMKDGVKDNTEKLSAFGTGLGGINALREIMADDGTENLNLSKFGRRE
jgi:hypothetical protein